MPFCAPAKIVTNNMNKIIYMEFYRTEQNIETNEWIEDKEQLIKLKCDYVISAFGSTLDEDSIKKAIEPVKFNRWGLPELDSITMATSEPYIFGGGDIGGISQTTVESVNDGKQSSWHMHRYLQSKYGIPIAKEPSLPKFYTPIDLVDIRYF
jgi:dihydropyrimidine dehydrogenase (NADP+)